MESCIGLANEDTSFIFYSNALSMVPSHATYMKCTMLMESCCVVEIDGLNDKPGQHSNKSLVLGAPGPYITLPSHSFLAYLGPQTQILLLDCRQV